MPHAKTRFHAVGQGCFYSGEVFCSENADPVRLVYDCGSESARHNLEREVTLLHQISGEAKLDVLVLSHLDADHVNGLPLLLDNGLTARNVFLPYLTPIQRAIAASAAGADTDPQYFEFLADPVMFLETRGVENLIFIDGGEDGRTQSSSGDIPPFQPSEAGDSPNLSDLEQDPEGKGRLDRGEGGIVRMQTGQPSQMELESRVGKTKDSMPKRKAHLHFKTDRLPFRLAPCWRGKFFHRDDVRLPIDTITGASDFTIHPEDSVSVQRYKRFLAEVEGRLGTLTPVRLVAAIRDENARKVFRGCYRHIRGNHNDVSLVFWHGPFQLEARVGLMSRVRPGVWRSSATVERSNGGTLLTEDLTCADRVVQKMRNHFGTLLEGSAFLHVPHHGSAHSWNDRLLAVTNPRIIPVICAGRQNTYRHPHPEVTDALDNTNGGVHWFFSDEHNPIAMRIQST